MLFIVKSGKLLLMIEERKVYLKEKKDSLPFEKLIFRIGQPVHVDGHVDFNPGAM